jgi:ribosome-associated heat shock protein Hsp15
MVWRPDASVAGSSLRGGQRVERFVRHTEAPVPEADQADDARERTRLDVWLDVACLYKTRSDAQKACRAGKVVVNGQGVKPHRLLKPGDQVVLTRGERLQTVVVLGFAGTHVSKAEARALYEDRTPPPTPAEVEARQLERLFRQSNPRPTRAPGRRDQRALRRLKGIT